jgi:hypothetical protein
MISKPIFKDQTHTYSRIIESAIENDLLDSLEKTKELTLKLIDEIPKEMGEYKYEVGKWTIKQLFKHISDSERIHSYRALRFARKDVTPLPSFNEDFYALSDNTEQLSLLEIKNEFLAIRNSTIQLYKTLDNRTLDYKGTANNIVFTPRIIGWVISGHNTHHCNVIESKYLNIK